MSAMSSWEQWYLTPPDDKELTCECGEPAEYIINDRGYCENCIDAFRVVPRDYTFCCMCEEEIDEGFSVDGECFCKECFEDSYKL